MSQPGLAQVAGVLSKSFVEQLLSAAQAVSAVVMLAAESFGVCAVPKNALASVLLSGAAIAVPCAPHKAITQLETLGKFCVGCYCGTRSIKAVSDLCVSKEWLLCGCPVNCTMACRIAATRLSAPEYENAIRRNG